MMSAIVPNSPDDVSVYNGRGRTRDEALVGAVMEAVERQTAARCELAQRTMRPDAIEGGLDLHAAGLRSGYAGVEMPFVRGLDVANGETVFVPTALVQMPWRGLPAFATTHTNGLAAAFSKIDAIRRALLELLERHLWALTEAGAHLRPKRILRASLRCDLAFVDDPVDELVLPCGDERVDDLALRIRAAGLTLRVVVMRAHGLPLAMCATVRESEAGIERAHTGLGAAWCPADAAVRAITEAMQARVADTQAARENILRAGDERGSFSEHTRRGRAPAYGRWYFDGPTSPVDLGALEDSSGPDIAGETRRLIAAVKRLAARIVVVDLSPPDGGYAVVRAIVPELETTLIDGRIGSLAKHVVAGA